jgi:hypothetical protein
VPGRRRVLEPHLSNHQLVSAGFTLNMNSLVMKTTDMIVKREHKMDGEPVADLLVDLSAATGAEGGE